MYRYLLVFLGLLSRLEGIWQETIKAIRLRLEFPLSLFSLTITSYRGRLSQVSPRLQTFKTVVDYMGLCCTIPQKGSQQNLVSFFWTSLLRRHSQESSRRLCDELKSVCVGSNLVPRAFVTLVQFRWTKLMKALGTRLRGRLLRNSIKIKLVIPTHLVLS